MAYADRRSRIIALVMPLRTVMYVPVRMEIAASARPAARPRAVRSRRRLGGRPPPGAIGRAAHTSPHHRVRSRAAGGEPPADERVLATPALTIRQSSKAKP
ncbi:hypothetical protein GCM10010246_14650 [Streptomyces cuspidosporus]|uniref:Uncharacterized protein n=1 Tax=Streptomyces cuspidosporus TaxID=66882 RepID=A0ABP5SIY6_9ACTN